MINNTKCLKSIFIQKCLSVKEYQKKQKLLMSDEIEKEIIKKEIRVRKLLLLFY